MSAPRRGMILAAGFGTRLLPVTRSLPKALLPIAGEPILRHILHWLAGQGVREVAVNAHHLADALEEWLDASARDDAGLPRVRLFREAEILGTGGGIANAASFLTDDPVVIANSDQLFEPDLAAAAEHHRRGGFAATLLLARDPWHAQVRVDAGRVVEIAPRPVFGDRDLWGFSGVYLLAAPAVEQLRLRATKEGAIRFHDVMHDLRRWMAEGRLGGFRDPQASFREIGTPEAWLELLRERTAPGASWVDPRATIAPDARIEESILLFGARVEAGAQVRRAILGAGVVAHGAVDRVLCAGEESRALAILSRVEEEEIHAFLHRSWPESEPSAPEGEISRPRARTFSLRRLQGDGSTRTLLRVADGGDTRVLVLPPRPESAAHSVYPRRANALSEAETFHYVIEYLARLGVRVPRIDGFDPATGRTLLEDLGSTHLADLLGEARRTGDPANAARAHAAYEEAVELLARMQAPAERPFDLDRTHNLDYDEAFILEYEAGYFLQRMAREFCGLRLTAAEESDLLAECRGFARQALEGAPRLFLHRDYQSRNLMVTPRGLAVIDVQGARLGPPEYDLVSLLEDPYADLPDEQRERLISRYLEIAGPAVLSRGAAEIRRRYEASLVNRLLQALGAYAYLGGTLGKAGFLEHAPAALRTLRRRAPIVGTRLDSLLQEVERSLWVPRGVGSE